VTFTSPPPVSFIYSSLAFKAFSINGKLPLEALPHPEHLTIYIINCQSRLDSRHKLNLSPVCIFFPVDFVMKFKVTRCPTNREKLNKTVRYGKMHMLLCMKLVRKRDEKADELFFPLLFSPFRGNLFQWELLKKAGVSSF